MSARNGRVLVLSVALTLSLIWLWMIRHRDPVAEFVADFDANLQGAPLAAEAARDDPRLRDELLEQSKAAFVRGGWPAANTSIRFLLASEIEPYADDSSILALVRAQLAALIALEPTPDLCKVFALAGSTPEIESAAKTEFAALSAAHWENVRNGLARKREGVEWRPPGYYEWAAAALKVEDGPTTLSSEEDRAFALSGAGTSKAVTVAPSALCRANIAIDRNILALPPTEGAHIERVLMSNTKRNDWLSRRAAMRQGEKRAPVKSKDDGER